ncbi:MAG: molybdenum cofactor guanylyltransferase [Salinivirgaceae bacterium]|jgi:molybdopterin-guanine dinucleotide biosynthesis protein A|nr:molybdenum cofactor guanylyltransferase [Salinivirgaceae bacterium]
MHKSQITGIVIAGGKSSRMGQNKALLKYHGKRLIDNAIQLLQKYTQNIIVSSNEPIESIPYSILPDEVKDIGPMGGLHSGLRESKSEFNLIIPCDVPNIELGLFSNFIAACEGYDAVIPILPNGKYEPLVACYNKTIIPLIEKAIQNNDYKLVNLIDKAHVKFIEVINIDQFKNINAPNDLL